MHGVATAAHFRRRDGLAGHGIDVDRVLHRFFLRLLERAVDLVRRAGEERSGERRGEAGEVGIEGLLPLVDASVLRLAGVLCGILLAEHHVMARRAGNAVARERAIVGKSRDRIRIILRRVWSLVDAVARKRLAGAGLDLRVDRMLALAQDAVTAKASVLDEC